MGPSKVRQQLPVAGLCACPVVWLLGVLTLCHCPGIWATAGVIALAPVAMGATQLQRLMGILFLTFSVGMAIAEFKAYARQQAAVASIKQMAMERSGAQVPASQPTTQP